MVKQTNLLESFKQLQKLESGMWVGSHLIKEMEIYGFIPYINSDNSVLEYKPSHIMLNLNNVTVTSDRAVFAIEKRCSVLRMDTEYIVHPIMRRIGLENGTKQLMLKDLYILSMCLDPHYQKLRNGRLIKGEYRKLLSLSEHIGIENDIVLYTTHKDDILMYKKKTYPHEKISAVASYFLVVCRYINPITGVISYSVFPPEDLILLANKEEPYGIF